MYKSIIISSLFIVFSYPSDFKWEALPTHSAKATKSKIPHEYKSGYENQLRASFNFKRGNRTIYDNNTDIATTRQINNGSRLYNHNVSSVAFIGTDEGAFGAGAIIGNYEIITNHHVVEGNETVDFVLHNPEVTTMQQISNDNIFSADVIAVDKKRDLALLKTNKYLNKQVTLGTNWTINIANDVFAIGHPEGLIWSFTYGVISGLPSPMEWEYDSGTTFEANCIQTQTPINPGNSGGPLFNDRGEMIGINSYGSNQGQGLNFAIRIDEINDFIQRARNNEYPKGEKRQELEWELIPDHGLDGIDEVFAADNNGDGEYDVWLGYVGNSDEASFRLFDIDFDGGIDMIHDVAENLFYIDEDGDGESDTLGRDTDGDWIPDEFKDYVE